MISIQQKSNGIMTSGKNINGVLGIGNQDLPYYSQKLCLRTIPELSNRKIISIACGDFHTLAIVRGYLPQARLPKQMEKNA